MSGKQNLIFFLLVTLMIVHGIVSGQFASLWDGLTIKSNSKSGGQSGWNPFTGIIPPSKVPGIINPLAP